MSINKVCRNYFHGFQDFSHFNKNSTKENLVAALKVLSYLTLLMPMGFGIAYGLSERAKHPSKTPKQNQTTEIAKIRLSRLKTTPSGKVANGIPNLDPIIIPPSPNKMRLEVNLPVVEQDPSHRLPPENPTKPKIEPVVPESRPIESEDFSDFLRSGYSRKESATCMADLVEAAEYFKKALPGGDANALSELADLYLVADDHLMNIGKPSEFKDAAIEMHIKAAKEGSERSIGFVHAHGLDGYVQDTKKAAEHLQIAADQGNSYAQFELGNLYCKGSGVVKDISIALGFYKLAGEKKHPIALYYLGITYLNGLHGIPKDLYKAREYLHKASELGHLNSQITIAYWIYSQHYYRDALSYFEMAAENGHANALYRIGDIYENHNQSLGDKSIKSNQEKAKEFYIKAAAKGSEYAIKKMEDLASKKVEEPDISKDGKALIAKGNHLFINGSRKAAHECYFKAVQLGEKKPSTLLSVGRALRLGDYLDRNINEAIKYLKEVVSQKNRFSDSALYHLGMIYSDGIGIDRDVPKAIGYLKQVRNIRVAEEVLKNLQLEINQTNK